MDSGTATRAKSRDAAILWGVLAVAAVRVVSTGSSILTLGIAARALNREEFGFVAALFSLWMVLAMLDLGISPRLTTRVAATHARDELDEMRAHVGEALFVMSAIGSLIAVGGTVSAFLLPWGQWIGGTLPTSTVRPAVILAFVLAGTTLPSVVGISVLIGRQRTAMTQLCFALGSLLTLIATATAALLDLGPWAFVLAFTGSPTLVCTAFTGWVVLGELRGVLERGGFDAGRLKSTIRSSAYFAAFGMGNTIALGMGTFIVASVLGPGEAAVFSVASRMFAMVTSAVVTSGSQLWPAMTEAITRGDHAWARRRYLHSIVISGLVTSAAGLALVAFGRPISRVWVGSALVPSLSLFVWMAALMVVIVVGSQVGVLLLAVDRIRALSAVCVANAVVGIAASVLLTRSMGVSGAAAGALLSFIGIFLPGIAVLARRTLKDFGGG